MEDTFQESGFKVRSMEGNDFILRENKIIRIIIMVMVLEYDFPRFLGRRERTQTR